MARRPRAARPAVAAALCCLQRAGECAGPVLRRVFPPDRVHLRAVLHPVRRAVRPCRTGWCRAPVSRLPRGTAGVPARPCRPALRRAGAATDPAVQARRPDRACGGAGTAHGACRRGAAARGGPAGAGAAALGGGCSGAATTRRRFWRTQSDGSRGGRPCPMRWCVSVRRPRSARSRPENAQPRSPMRSRCEGRGLRW
jgi:hypothetical protein